MSVIGTASRVLRDEADAVISLVDKLDGQFEEAVHLIENAKSQEGGSHHGQHRHASLFPSSGRGHSRRSGHGDCR